LVAPRVSFKAGGAGQDGPEEVAAEESAGDVPSVFGSDGGGLNPVVDIAPAGKGLGNITALYG